MTDNFKIKKSDTNEIELAKKLILMFDFSGDLNHQVFSTEKYFLKMLGREDCHGNVTLKKMKNLSEVQRLLKCRCSDACRLRNRLTPNKLE